jgi:hypothetical protein
LISFFSEFNNGDTMVYKRIYAPAIVAVLIIVALLSCTTPAGQTPIYDSSKSYVAFLVLDTVNGKTTLENLKQRSLSEGYEIGPAEFYIAGTKDFEPIIKTLTPSPQIKLIWIASSLLDVPDIQKALTKLEYQGQIRYMPATTISPNKDVENLLRR